MHAHASRKTAISPLRRSNQQIPDPTQSNSVGPGLAVSRRSCHVWEHHVRQSAIVTTCSRRAKSKQNEQDKKLITLWPSTGELKLGWLGERLAAAVVFVEGNATPCQRLWSLDSWTLRLSPSAPLTVMGRNPWTGCPSTPAPATSYASSTIHRPRPTLGLPNSTADHTFNGPTTLEVMPTSPPEQSPMGFATGSTSDLGQWGS